MHSSRGRPTLCNKPNCTATKYKHYKRNTDPEANMQQQNQHYTTKFIRCVSVCLAILLGHMPMSLDHTTGFRGESHTFPGITPGSHLHFTGM